MREHDHESSLSHEDVELIRRLMAITQDLALSVKTLATAVDDLSVRIGGVGPKSGFSVSDADVQAAIQVMSTETDRLNALLPATPPISRPQIALASPASGPVGTQITFTGVGFGSTQGSSTLSFNGILAAPTSWSDTQIITTVPAGALTGNVMLVVNGNNSNQFAFTVS
jgi:hypothetical protein